MASEKAEGKRKRRNLQAVARESEPHVNELLPIQHVEEHCSFVVISISYLLNDVCIKTKQNLLSILWRQTTTISHTGGRGRI